MLLNSWERYHSTHDYHYIVAGRRIVQSYWKQKSHRDKNTKEVTRNPFNPTKTNLKDILRQGFIFTQSMLWFEFRTLWMDLKSWEVSPSFQLYSCCHFYWWMKSKNSEKTSNLLQITSHKVMSSAPRQGRESKS
jgi:hypothetical protein